MVIPREKKTLLKTKKIRKTPEQLWEEAGYTNNFIFRMVMDDENRCKQLLERLLAMKIEVVEIRQPEKSTEFDNKTKGIRLDLYIKDMSGIVYDVEMQTGENTTDYFGKRTRYYQSALDMELLNKGNSYRRLGRTIIIFICTFDPFEKDLSRYTFRNKCEEDDKVELQDDTVKIFFNAKGKRDGLSAELTNFLDYVSGKAANDDFTRQLDDSVKMVKQDRRKRVDFMTWQQQMIEVREETLEECREEIDDAKAEAEAAKAEAALARAEADEREAKALRGMIESGLATIEDIRNTGRYSEEILSMI